MNLDHKEKQNRSTLSIEPERSNELVCNGVSWTAKSVSCCCRQARTAQLAKMIQPNWRLIGGIKKKQVFTAWTLELKKLATWIAKVTMQQAGLRFRVEIQNTEISFQKTLCDENISNPVRKESKAYTLSPQWSSWIQKSYFIVFNEKKANWL